VYVLYFVGMYICNCNNTGVTYELNILSLVDRFELTLVNVFKKAYCVTNYYNYVRSMSTFQHLSDSSNVQTNVVIVFRQLVNHWEEYFTVN